MKSLTYVLLAVALAVASAAHAADTIVYPTTNGGDALIKFSNGKTGPISACMTSDGSGNMVPISGGGGGGGGAVSISGKAALGPVHVDFSSTNVTTGGYVELVTSTVSAITLIHVDSICGNSIKLAVGGSGSEVDQFTIPRGASNDFPLAIPSGSRISAEALSGDCTAGDMDLSLFN